MPSPLFLIAVSFFTIIVVGSVLVALNDWLEGLQADPGFSLSIGLTRSLRPLFVRPRRRLVHSAVRSNRTEPRLKRPDMIVDWF